MNRRPRSRDQTNRMARSQDDIFDEWLVLRCQDGEADALRELVTRWQPRLLRHARHLVGQSDEAGEVVQEAWLAIIRGIPRLRDPAAFRSWVYRIVSRRCADWVRRRQRDRAITPQTTTAPDTPAPTTVADSDCDELTDLRCAIRHLPAQQRTVLALHYLDGLSVREVAGALDIPQGTVKSRLHHARNTLREVIERTQQ